MKISDSKNITHILLFTAVAMLLHTIEEYFTKLYDHDPFIVYFSHYFNLNPVIVYLLLQILVLSLIFILLKQSFDQRLNKFLAVLLGLVFLLELIHPYDSIKIMSYYSGLYTGLILVFIGFFYWKSLIKNLNTYHE